MLSAVIEIMHQGGTEEKESSPKEVLSLYTIPECPQHGLCDGRD